VSNSLLSRCLEVWKEQDRPFTEKYRSYLPDHILEEFESYTYQKSSPGINSTFYRLARPTLSYSTDFQNIFIKLPIQRFGKNAPLSIEWRIFSNDYELKLLPKRYTAHESGEVEFIVDRKNGEHPVKPLHDYTVHLIIDGKVNGEWAFYLDEKVMFDAKSYDQINKNFITVQNVLLILNEEAFNIVEQGSNSYLVRPLSGDWSGFYEVDLFITEVDTLQFRLNTLLLNPFRNLVRIKGEVVENVKSETTIYMKQPLINVDSDILSINKDLSKWNIRLYHGYTKKTLRKTIDEMTVNLSPEGLQFNLYDLITEMGEAFGKYSISLSGVLGYDESIEFIYLSDNDFNFMTEKNQMNVHTSQSFEFTIPSILEVEKRSDSTKSFTLPNHPQYVKGNLLNINTNERIELKLYTAFISYEIRLELESKPMGQIFDSTQFEFEKASILLDLENPSLLKDNNLLTVILKEKLKTGEYATKTFNCRKDRKHILELSFFQNLHGTTSKRTIALSIPELGVFEKVVTIETEWTLENVITPTLTNTQLSWKCSFQPEKVTARIWSFLSGKELLIETKVNQLSNTAIYFQSEDLPDGYYIFELAEDDEEDIFAFLNEVKFPDSLNSHNKLIKVDYNDSLPSFTEWLLLEDEYGDEREWETAELEEQLSCLWKHESITVPLLLENYYSCCDFGLQNIDHILKIIISKIKNLSHLLIKFPVTMIGMQIHLKQL
jgi:hypothetical protein